MNKRGFTLVELIAVIAILALIAIITTPAYDKVSENIRTRNYNSKKSVIEKQTLEYVENYLKDVVYSGKSNPICFSVKFLIQNGIVTSDNEKEEYIKNDINGKVYEGSKPYILIYYNNETRKLKSIFLEDEEINSCELKDTCKVRDDYTCNIYK